MRNDDGRCLAWFEISQGLCNKRLLSPLIFNVFLAEIPLVAIEKIGEDADILTDLAYMQERPSKVGPETSQGMCAACYWGDAVY